MAVWLVARRDFTFKGASYRSGDVFEAAPLVAVQMRAIRAVSFAKAPLPPPDPTPMPVRRKRTYATKHMEAEPVAPEPTPAPEPAPMPADDDQNIDLPHDD